MDIVKIISIIKLIALLTAIIIFVFKLRTTQRYKSKNRHPGMRWILWYDSMEILGTSSPTYRDFMQTHNRLSTIMWIAVLLMVLLFIIPF
jgi:hypothetical protein